MTNRRNIMDIRELLNHIRAGSSNRQIAQDMEIDRRGVRRTSRVWTESFGAGGGDRSRRDRSGSKGYPNADCNVTAVPRRFCLNPGYNSQQPWGLSAPHPQKRWLREGIRRVSLHSLPRQSVA
jgi:hypothetical protein